MTPFPRESLDGSNPVAEIRRWLGLTGNSSDSLAEDKTLAGDIYLEERSDVNRYTLAFDRLRAASLHPDDSVQMIERLARTLR